MERILFTIKYKKGEQHFYFHFLITCAQSNTYKQRSCDLMKVNKNLSKSEGKNWPLGVQCCRQHDKLKSFNWKIGYMMSSQAITNCIVRGTFAISSTNINSTTNNAIHFYVFVCFNANNKNRNILNLFRICVRSF